MADAPVFRGDRRPAVGHLRALPEARGAEGCSEKTQPGTPASSEPAVIHKPATVVMAPAPAGAPAAVAPPKAAPNKGASASGAVSTKSGTTGTIISFLRRSGEEKELHAEPEPEPQPEPQPDKA